MEFARNLKPVRGARWVVQRWRRERHKPTPEEANRLDPPGKPPRLIQQDEPAERLHFYDEGAMIYDRTTGVSYRVTVGRDANSKPYVLTLEVEPPGHRKTITSQWLARINLGVLADLTAMAVDQTSGLAPGQTWYIRKGFGVHGRGDVPDLASLAALYDEQGRAAVIDQYATEYEVSASTVDRWIRMARDQGFLTDSSGNRGRPARKATTSTKNKINKGK